MPLPEPRNCGWCGEALDPSRQATTRYCSATCRNRASDARQGRKKARRRGKRPDTSYVVLALVSGDVQTFRLAGYTSANSGREAVKKLAEYVPEAEFVAVPRRSFSTISA